MKKFWNNIKIVILLFICWRLLLALVQMVANFLFVSQENFRGPTPWANFDGIHYLGIAANGYRQYLEAFFPLYPLVIRWGADLTTFSLETTALVFSHAAAVVGVVLFYVLNLKINHKASLWPTLLLLLFPTSFFFAAVYPTSLYLALAGACLWCIEKRRWWWAGILGAAASATHIFGVYLIFVAAIELLQSRKKNSVQDAFAISLMPLGLVGYMAYLWKSVGDPLAFFHEQPIFGANRSGAEFIFLPQVLWRYMKIFTTADPSFSYLISTFEFITFVFAIVLFVIGWQKKLKLSLLAYCAAVIITPTLTGTFSSFPRYILAAFPLFFTLESLSESMKLFLALLFGLGLIYFASAFLQGYFVA